MSELAKPVRDATGPRGLSAERAALGEAIARRSAAEAHLERIEAAVERAGEMAREAYREEDRAAAALAEAHEAEPRWLADSILADREPGTSPLRAAEAALALAREERAAARHAGDVLRQEVDPARTAVDYAGRAVRRAAAAVAAASPAIEAAVERLERAEAELVAAGDQVRWLSAAGVFNIRTPAPGGTIVDESPRDKRVRQALQRLNMPPSGWLRERAPMTGGWEQALAALEADADAPLPDVDKSPTA